MSYQRAPLCANGHGRLVPIEYEYAFAPNGVVEATVTWYTGGLVAIFCTDMKTAQKIPHEAGPELGNQIDDLGIAGKLFPAKDLYARLEDCYRIDDFRPNGDSYLIWGGESEGRGPTLRPRTVYYFITKGPKEGWMPKRIKQVNYEQVRTLMRHPDAVRLKTPRKKKGTHYKGKIVAQNMQAI